MNRKIIAIIVLGLVLFACLLACGYFGVKTVRRTRLRHTAMTAYENKDYNLAERLLLQYIGKDPNAEAEVAALASIYHEFGNAEQEAQMWQTASSLNPLNPEYRENMLTSAIQATSYPLLHNILGRKAKANEDFSDQELYLYVISSYRSDYSKDGRDAYQKSVQADPDSFHKNELGRWAEFVVLYPDLSESEREAFLDQALRSEDPVVRFEAIYVSVRRAAQHRDDNPEIENKIEELLKQAVETNYFAGMLYLADYYFSKLRFSDVTALLEPYLKTIDNASLYLLYAESCVFDGKLDELKTLEEKLREKPASLAFLAEYCKILIAHMEDDVEKLVIETRRSGNIIISPLSRFIRLRVAMKNDSFYEILTVAQEIFSNPPFHDLNDRTLLICMDYISKEMMKPENRKAPSRMAELAKILSGYLHGNRLLTEIILMDQYKKGLAKGEDLMAALEQFPDDALLQQVTAEYLVLNGKPEQALEIIKPILAAMEEEEQEPDLKIFFLYMLALDQLERRDEASIIFQKLVEQSEFDLDLLGQYFQFCVDNKRTADLTSMADKLVTVKDGKLEHYGNFFRAAALLTTENESTEKEALDLLVSAPTGDPEFTFYAATQLCEHDRLDEAEAKYKAILKTYRIPALLHINLSNIYHEKGDEKKALETAKEAFDLEKQSMLPAFIYAKRLSEANRYEDAVRALDFPRHAVNYREDIVELWVDCMHHVIEKSMADERFIQAEEQCLHLLVIVPDDEFGKENLEKVRERMKQKKIEEQNKAVAPAA